MILKLKTKSLSKKGLDEYYKYQLDNEHLSFNKGTGFHLIDNLLKINKYFDANERQVKVIILSKNNAATSLRITNAINKYKLEIERSGWTSCKSMNIIKYV